jgi:hypothetical protein
MVASLCSPKFARRSAGASEYLQPRRRSTDRGTPRGSNILDPCTAIGNFIVNLLRRIPKEDLPRMDREPLFDNRVMD